MHVSAELSETLRHQHKKCETLLHQTHSAEMSWVQSILGPKCPYTVKGLNFGCHLLNMGDLGTVVEVHPRVGLIRVRIRVRVRVRVRVSVS